jgi:L-threonylcarbamoyladenylate synthase
MRFWPGPLTLVLPRGAAIPDNVTGGGATVAVRVPAHPVAQALLRAAGLPIAAPSANRSMQLSPTRAEHVRRGLGGRIPLILDGGPTPGGIESTVLDVTTDPPRLLRPGLISVTDLEAVIGPVSLESVVDSGTIALPSPGLAARHYAPRTPLECVPDGFTYAQDLAGQGQRVGLVLLGKGLPGPPHPGVIVVELPDDSEGYAAGLFAALHALDECQLQRIVVTLPPDTPAWMGVRDRLRRAIHFPKTRISQ